MNRKDAHNSLNDIPTRVGMFRARRVAAGMDSRVAEISQIARPHRAPWARVALMAVTFVCSTGAVPAMAESCEARCQQVREEGFSTIANPDGTQLLCCCLVDDAGQSQSKPLEECGKIP